MAVTEKISKLIRNQLPDFYKEDAPNLIAFFEAYFEWMEESGNLTDALRNLEDYQRIDTTTDEFVDYFISKFIPGIPTEVQANKRLLVKYAIDANLSRGTLSAYKLLFRALYNEDIEVYYPSDNILKVSGGDWRIDRYLITSYDPQTYTFVGKTIVGIETSSEALVEEVIRRKISGRDLLQINVSNIKGTFNHLEQIALKSDTNLLGHIPTIECGIDSIEILSTGASYRPGDVLDVISNLRGQFAKLVVTDTIDLGGVITFDLNNGGSGYSTSTNGSTQIRIEGGDGDTKASFRIGETNIEDAFALAVNVTRPVSNNVFGSLGPVVVSNGQSVQISTFADTPIGMSDYGFPEEGEDVGNRDYRDHANAVLRIANTQDIKVGDSLYGVTSSANATVLSIIDNTPANTVVRIDGYRNFSTASGGESIRSIFGNTSGNTVGSVISFSGNTIGYHVAQIGWVGNTVFNFLSEGDELVGRTSGAYGVVKKIIRFDANGYSRGVGGADDRDLYTVQLTSNNTANMTSQFDTGPMRAFIENEGVRLVGANTTVGNVVFTTSNSQIENAYTKLSDSLLFVTTTFGSIAKLSSIVSGSGYTVRPTVSVKDTTIAALGIGEQYITLQSDDVNWGTGNSQITSLDSTDRIEQTTSGASGDIKGGDGTAQPQVVQYANGTYETVARVWQDFLQRTPGNVYYANNATVALKIYDTTYIPGETDNRTPVATGSAKIVSIRDTGVLGDNAVINPTLGSNGTISNARIIDSGFGYVDNEIVSIEVPNRTNASGATVKISLGDVANSSGYYATSRGHLDSLSAYIQDSEYYQEFSYEIVSPITLSRYRDYALELAHPSGQALFGKYRTNSYAETTVTAMSDNKKRLQSNGTVSISNGSFDIVGSGTDFLSEFANGSIFVIEHSPNQYYKIPINIVSNDTSANLTIAWANSSISSANAYYYDGVI